jgi:hypothetical protein
VVAAALGDLGQVGRGQGRFPDQLPSSPRRQSPRSWMSLRARCTHSSSHVAWNTRTASGVSRDDHARQSRMTATLRAYFCSNLGGTLPLPSRGA